MTHLVVGLGEVGKALQEIFGCEGIDKDKYSAMLPSYGIMHICFPYSEFFESEVKRYQELFKPKYVVVHSTVPIGTCEKLGVNHSPVRGRHPDLVKSLKTFMKYVGGPHHIYIAAEFVKVGIPSTIFSRARDCEALKLWDTTQYGAMITLEKEIYQFCQDNNVSFDKVYTMANKSYNDGYEEMGLPQVRRPVLDHQEGKIGGHCVVQNCRLLDSPTAKKILSDNT